VLDIVLVEPQIATNTGSIIRLCANVGARLHLVRPLGFTLDSAALRRGGLDYHELTETTCWDTWDECRAGIGRDRRWFATTAGAEQRRYDEVDYRAGDVVVFGREADGLPAAVLDDFPVAQRLRIPMRPFNRSINLAGAVSVVAYEAWRQHGFEGAATGTFAEGRPPLPEPGRMPNRPR
jgi:tRNA (cytidine/uridine-2'-O-)-methyltransferase